jgi:drug/metabolite transporter (DMT)-like permease
MMSLYKVPSAKQISKYTLSAWSFFIASLIAGIVFHEFIVVDFKVLFYSFLWGTGYSLLTLTQMHALHKHDTSGVYPFTSLASNIFVIIGGVLFLKDVISPLQWGAIVLSMLLFVVAHWKSKINFIVEILPLFTFIALLSTFNKFVQKAGASSLEIHNFIFWQLVFAFIASLIILIFTAKKFSFKELTHRNLLGWAFAIGALNFGSNYAIVKALSTGPISLVYVTLGLYTFFTAIFAALLFKEKITKKSLMFIGLSFLVVLLIKFG